MNEQSFYPSSGRASIVTSPDDMPRYFTRGPVNVLVESAAGNYRNTEAEFFTAINNQGAINTVAVANTWVKLLEVAGSGLLGNVLASHGYTTGVKTVGIKLEVDGVNWEWVETFSGSNTHTLLLGAIVVDATEAFATFSQNARYSDRAENLLNDPAPRLLPVGALMSKAAPVLGFKESLTVWVKNSAVNATSQGQQAGCTFVLRDGVVV